MMISGHRKSFHAPIKLKTVSVAIIGRHSGSMMRQKIANSEKPSMRAASRISSGISIMNWRIMKIAKTAAEPGRTSPA